MNKSHLSAVLAKHHDLDSRIETESHRPHPNEGMIHDLKKQKLRLKDSLATG